MDKYYLYNHPKEWDLKPLNDCCSVVSKTCDPKSAVGMPYLGLEHLASGLPFIIDIGDSAQVRSAKTVFQRQDVLYGKLRPYLRKAVLAPFDGICSTDIIVMRSNSEILSEFLAFLVHSDQFVNRAKATTSGVNHPRTAWSKLKPFLIPVPPLSEQQKIAALLSAVQRAIEQQEQLIVLVTELKKALMYKLFTEGTLSEKQKQTEIGLVPESWEVVPLTLLIADRLQNGAFVKKPVFGKGFLFANVVDMYRDVYLDYRQLKRINVPEVNIDQYFLNNDDLLVVRSSLKREGIGQNCIVKAPPERVFYDCHLIRVVPDKDKVLPEFLSYFWRSPIGKADLIRRSKTTTMTTINQQSLGSALIPVPQRSEQREIVEALLLFDSKIMAHRELKIIYSILFRTLLHQLMTAQIRVNDLDLTALGYEPINAGEEEAI